MSEPKSTKRLNDILDLFTFGGLPQPNEAHRIFGLDQEHSLSLNGDNCRKFDSAIDDLLESIPSARTTLSEEKLIQELIPEIRQKKIENCQFSQAECDSFQQKILAIPVGKYRILRTIYGVTLTQGAGPVHIGNFTIYDANLHSSQIASGLPNSTALFRFKKPSGFLIECVVDARDEVKAVELADVLFYRLELFIRFFIGRRTTRFEVGVLNYVGPQMRDHIVIGEKTVTEGGAWQGALEPIQIADPFFCSPPPPLARLLQLLVKQNNQFEVHVVRCAEWTAQAMSDPNAASAFVKAAIALEVLFSANEKGVITPSIMAQIAESCAFLLGDSAASATEVEREVKRLYGIRSAVVHSGKDSVANSDLNALIRICRDVVIVLLSSKELENVVSMETLAEHFKVMKYASIKATKG
ncbi:MAG: hypothetical protein ABSG77_00885 [Candidatus Acidiferrum sp.]|jgi:hypothetical protein